MTRIGAGLWGQFQFTPLREGRRENRNSCSPKQISIHAPPRGATYANGILAFDIEFQFTPLREGRLVDGTVNEHIYISIHAPPRGATRRSNA